MSESVVTSAQPRWAARVAAIAGVVGFLFFVAVPFLPVHQVQSSLQWPQDGRVSSVTAPLISYAPDRLEAQVPVRAVHELRKDESVILGTLPNDSTDAFNRGLFVRSFDGGMDVVTRGHVIFELSPRQVAALPQDTLVTVSTTPDGATVAVSGDAGSQFSSDEDAAQEDLRPQVAGVFTELTEASAPALIDAGLRTDIQINSRFTTSPTAWKAAAMIIGGVCLVISLWALRVLDRADGRGRIRVMPTGWWRPRGIDAVVGGVLAFWHIFGANTSDDGYLLTMGRLADHAGYMANYYRWFGVPESPFGWPYYDLLGLMTRVSTASVWMRLPALIAALIIWLLLSRFLLPLLGGQLGRRRLAQWTAALVFLTFWLPYNNGTRPEPAVALGAVAAWVAFEHAIAARRLFPAAIGVILATLSLAAGPTGLMAVAALVAALAPLLRILIARLPQLGPDASRGRRIGAVLALVGPFLAAGTAILVGVFGHQTLASVLEATRVRSQTGPALPWYEEFARYQSLLSLDSVDGSITRRFPVFIFLAALVIVGVTLLRRREITGVATAPTVRLLIIVIGSFFFLMFTPTKWTHHFGAHAGIAAALAAIAAVAVSAAALKSARALTLISGAFLMIFALALAGKNGWWYVSSFAVPWWDRPIQLHAIFATSVVLYLALAVLVCGVALSFLREVRRGRGRAQVDEGGVDKRTWRGLAAAPIAVLSAAVLVLSLGSFAKGFAEQYPAYSVGKGNLRNLTGHGCALADDVLVETNTNESFLTPADGSPLGDSLDQDGNRGFGPNQLPKGINGDADSSTSSASNSDTIAHQVADDDATDHTTSSGQDTGTSGGSRAQTQKGPNGSTQKLPFNIDYTKVPVLGSYQQGEQRPAKARSAWYTLPRGGDATPVVVVSAFGKIHHHDINGIEQKGQDLVLEYGTRDASGKVTDTGSVEMYDVGGSPQWRNLRYPIDKLPEAANVVRIQASDTNLDEDEWVGFLPPRVPTLDTLSQVIGTQRPGLIDWPVGFQFPCQRPFDHYAGVIEIPEYRISPDYPGKSTLTPVQNYVGGGPMGTTEAVNTTYELPGYLRHDWGRDWGSIELYRLRTNSQGDAPTPAHITEDDVIRSGIWSPGKMHIKTKKD
ncbi:arabinosyltransferase domain-containing protein [Corynebacterium uberis]|uniref:arabinosyltransferase domain-containing protein n=1 Tax=Corynebacterium TaxID=1716 RepID=UPI001D0A17DF|nr:arabinosyltransferase domain-containing protein [Corynebacterium uberis]MCZ9309870.1 arabinosyltransferase domain-containing protein [Corynebacterium sp. c6VSa_13]UDL73205.1 arabinosyltransferase domain-containing protein [Corynebacterium uberis]UDL75918.1 arabinosyltransferase domain-containing protein [Corynebacterium uberis]UDL78130.1 arabinosyltransferase domain-containing protein [Corynebacterium uberis]UDL80413.1 arabinosyltransferase domain-containing protein [Corynebacterium uberis]